MPNLTKEQKTMIAEQARLELARRELESFLLLDGRGNWKSARHLSVLCQKMQEVESGKIKRLMVFMPPRHGKSEVVSKKFPAWYLMRNPEKEVIISAYSADLSYDFSRIARQTFNEWGKKLFDVEIAHDSGAVNRWGLEGYRGGLTAAGVGGPITGRGAHVAVIDDPVKNWEEAASDTMRRRVWEWYRSTLRTRLAPGGSIVLVMTRWHEDDLAGKLIKEAKDNDGEKWEIINLPAEAGENDILGRNPGEWLWPERYPSEEYEATKKALGSYLWSAMYQQSPRPAGGKIFKQHYFRYFSDDGDVYTLYYGDGHRKHWRKRDCFVFQTCDPAASTKSTADYFVLATWVVTPHKELLLRDIIRERLEGPDQPQLFKQAMHRWSPVLQGVETKAMGLTLFQTLQRMGLPLFELSPGTTDKVTRAIPMAARYEAGMVYHLQGAPWLDEFESELLAFPNGRHDDQVDATSYAHVVLNHIEESTYADDTLVYDDEVHISPF